MTTKSRRRTAGVSPKRPPQESSLAPDKVLLKTAVGVVVIYAVLQTIAWAMLARGYLDSAMEGLASLTATMSNLVGVHATTAANEVYLATRTLRIDFECTGLSLMLVYSALVLAYPLGPKNKVTAIAVGLPAIFVANLIRLVLVAGLSDPLPDRAFLFVHDYLFKVGMVIVVIGLWAAYLVRARRSATQP